MISLLISQTALGPLCKNNKIGPKQSNRICAVKMKAVFHLHAKNRLSAACWFIYLIFFYTLFHNRIILSSTGEVI